MIWFIAYIVILELVGFVLAWKIAIRAMQPKRDARGRFAKRGN